MFWRDGILSFIRWVFTRTGFVYFLIAILAVVVVDFKAVDSRIKIRRLNDARPSMEALVSFCKGETLADKLDWKPYVRYFSMVFKYMPGEDVGKMFLAVCKYYTGDQGKDAFGLMRSSAERYPFVFWNIYNTAAMAFEQGDMALAIQYLERARLLPLNKVAEAMSSSVVYRQLMASGNFDVQAADRINKARENVYLLLAAAHYYMKNYEKSRGWALAAFEKNTVRDPEPFYFYAGAACFALGRMQESVSFLSKCVELKSRNPLVYQYLGELLKASGRADVAANVLRTGEELRRSQGDGFPYPDCLRLRLF